MELELRPVTEEEFPAVLRADSTAFGIPPPGEEEIADWRGLVEPDRTLAVLDGGHVVATAAAIAFELTLPGLTTIPAAGVSLVAVVPTHRRRGLLRRLMARQLEDVGERGEAVAVLNASESLIYGRFGYGLASSHLDVEVDRRHGALTVPPSEGQVTLLEADEAGKVLPAIFDQARRRQPGDLDRSAARWEVRLRDREQDRKGASARFHAVHESALGEADGYATYRVRSHWEHGQPRGRVLADEVVALTPEAYAGLWRFLLSLDLTEAVEARNRPVDEPLRWMLADPRRLRVTLLSDFLWLRLVDVGTALAARRYPVAGRLVLDVADAFCPGKGGRYALEGGPDGAECRPTDAEPDLALGTADLASLYLGGVAASALAAAGRVAERRPGALARADAMLACHPRPFCRTGF